MKKIVTFMLGVLPLWLAAQNPCNFFDHRTIQIEKTDLNSVQSDFGPAFGDNELWFSAYTEQEIKKLSAGDEKDVFYNLFNAKLDSEGHISGNKTSPFEAISEGYHAGPVSYCKNTQELFVTLSNFENPDIKNKVYRKADIRLKIIVAKKTGGQWKVTEEFPYNDPAYSVGHPAISVTGDTLFFASNKPETGSGETDLYMSVRKLGKWGQPINLGAEINTEFDEMFPFFFNGSMLFYASNAGTNQKADFDILYSCINGNSFSAPQKVTELNTEEDDFGLVIHDDGKIGYFASQRNGGLGDDDIYKVQFTGEYSLELLVMDNKSKLPIANPKVHFSDDVTGIVSGYVVSRDLTENATVLATSQQEGYQNSSVSVSTVNQPFGVIRDTIWVEKVEVGQKFVLENIFYDFDKWDILPASEVELNKLIKVLDENPSWKVELGSHTDSRGSDSYNERLSQKRSDSAVNYMVSKGISRSRIIAKGYGESQLVNHCKNGVTCSDEEHRQNRRTEFTILEMDGRK